MSNSAFEGVGSPNSTIERTFRAEFLFPPKKKQAKAESGRSYRNPIIMAQEWQERLHREGCTPAYLARTLGISRARVTQVLRLLRLTPVARQMINDLGDPLATPIVSEHFLRPLVTLSPIEQQQRITDLLHRDRNGVYL